MRRGMTASVTVGGPVMDEKDLAWAEGRVRNWKFLQAVSVWPEDDRRYAVVKALATVLGDSGWSLGGTMGALVEEIVLVICPAEEEAS